MYKVLKRTRLAIVPPIRSFVLPRPRCRRRRGLFKVAINVTGLSSNISHNQELIT